MGFPENSTASLEELCNLQLADFKFPLDIFRFHPHKNESWEITLSAELSRDFLEAKIPSPLGGNFPSVVPIWCVYSLREVRTRFFNGFLRELTACP